MSILELYLLTVLFSLGGTMTALGFVAWGTSFILGFFLAMEGCDYDLEEGKELRFHRPFKRSTIVALSLTILTCFIPSKEEGLWIAGGHIVTNIDGLGDIPENAVEAANTFLKSISKDQEKDSK
jgi:hypothetical protein